MADRDQVACYLETADPPRNADYYARHGFVVENPALQVVPNGPAHIAMRAAPAPSRGRYPWTFVNVCVAQTHGVHSPPSSRNHQATVSVPSPLSLDLAPRHPVRTGTGPTLEREQLPLTWPS